MGLFDYMETVGQAGGEFLHGAGKVVGGTAATAVGSALHVGGVVADPVLYGTGKVIMGVTEGLDQGNDLYSADEYDDIQEQLSWPGWGDGVVTQFGEDLAIDGVTTAGTGAFGHGGNVVELLLGLDSNPQNDEEFLEVMQDAYGKPTVPVQVVSALLSPGKLGRVITVSGIVHQNSTAWLEERGVKLPKELTQDEYDQILAKERRKAQSENKLVTDMQTEVEEAEQVTGEISPEQAWTYARILAGPDGWGSLNQSDRGTQAWFDAKAGKTREVLRSWKAWRAAGGKWRHDV